MNFSNHIFSKIVGNLRSVHTKGKVHNYAYNQYTINVIEFNNLRKKELVYIHGSEGRDY